jgi:hypothetical protein
LATAHPCLNQIGIQAATVHPRSRSTIYNSNTRKTGGRPCRHIRSLHTIIYCLLYFYIGKPSLLIGKKYVRCEIYLSSRLGPPAWQGKHAACTRRGIDETLCSWQTRRSLHRFDRSHRAETLDPIQSALVLWHPQLCPIVHAKAKKKSVNLQVTTASFFWWRKS